MKQRDYFAFFTEIAGVLLAVTAVIKIASSFGTARILASPDPVFLVPFKDVLRIVGFLELVAAAVCFAARNPKVRVAVVVLVANNFLLYRLGLYWLGFHGLCPCMGTISDALHVSPQATDVASKSILGYLVIGGYVALFWLRRRGEGARQHPSK